MTGRDADGEDASREIFDYLSLRVISILEAHPAACAVQFSDQPGVSQGQLQAWESQYRPYVLPDDFKAFLAISDGVTVRWSLRFSGQVVPFGVVHVNELEMVKPVPLDDADLQHFSSACAQPRLTPARTIAAFDLDSECAKGRVALLYRAHEAGAGDEASASTGKPQVWFQDLSCRWHFLADTFADYFRLIATHLGVPQWQYAFTEIGLDPAARHWLALFCPGRLAVDTERGPAAKAQAARHGARRGVAGRSSVAGGVGSGWSLSSGGNGPTSSSRPRHVSRASASAGGGSASPPRPPGGVAAGRARGTQQERPASAPRKSSSSGAGMSSGAHGQGSRTPGVPR